MEPIKRKLLLTWAWRVGGQAQYVTMINWALNQWAAVSGFTNLGHVADGGANAGATQANNGHLGDIRVAAWEITSAATLAHAFQPGIDGMFANSTVLGDVHFDVSGRLWVDQATDALADADIDIYTVALHEIGHALGLGHSTDVNSVMFANYSGGRRTLTADDIAGIRAIYGVPEPGTIVGMFSLATFGVGIFIARRRRDKKLAA
ncbi:MAG: matrixin family metalloprotease [Planctomycetaceae bacterium]